MKKLTIVISIAALTVSLLPVALAATEEAKEPARAVGEKIFLDGKCNMCHTVTAAGIGEPREDEGDEDVSLPPDLSFTGSNWAAEWLDLYLLKKEAIEGKKHKKKFKGSDEERGLLVEWLASMKAPVADSTAVAPEAVPEVEGSMESPPVEEEASPAEPSVPETGAESEEG